MAITFKSVGHFFATAYKALVKDLPKIEATQTVVEGVTAVAAPQAVPVENAAYAILGEVSALLNAGGDAAASKLANAGLDINVINDVKAVVASVPTLATVAKSL